MGEAAVKLPNKSVVFALFKKHGEVKEKTSSIGGDWSAQLQRHAENGNLHRGAFNAASSIVRKAGNNELAALEHLDHLRVYLDWAEEAIRSRGHVGDLAEQAKEREPAKPADAMPADQALAAFEANKDKAPTPAEVDAKTEARAEGRKRGGRKPKNAEPDSVDQFREELRSTVKAGDDHIKSVADDYVEDQNRRLGPARGDEGDDDLAPPAAPPSAPKRQSQRNGLGPDAIH